MPVARPGRSAGAAALCSARVFIAATLAHILQRAV
jgi:hypothetical protein